MVPDAKPPHVSALFGYIASLHGDRPWGSMLDAGAGVKSLQWIRTLPTDSWTAITAAPGMADSVRAALGEAIRPQDRLLVGNWIDDDLLAGETFDTVLVDYLVGAIEGFAPYWQDRAFEGFVPWSPTTAALRHRPGTLCPVPTRDRKRPHHLGDRPGPRRVSVVGR